MRDTVNSLLKQIEEYKVLSDERMLPDVYDVLVKMEPYARQLNKTLRFARLEIPEPVPIDQLGLSTRTVTGGSQGMDTGLLRNCTTTLIY